MSCKFLTIKTRPTGKAVSYPDKEYQHLCSLKMDSEKQRSIIHQILVKKGIEHFITDDCPFAATGSWSKCPYNYDLI